MAELLSSYTCSKIFDRNNGFQTVGGLINHFTDVNAVVSILKSGRLRLSLLTEMRNDSKEGRYVKTLYQETL